jgi:hypothetical protein
MEEVEDSKVRASSDGNDIIAKNTNLIVQVHPTETKQTTTTTIEKSRGKEYNHDRSKYQSSSSRLFQPYRTLGIITSGRGFYAQPAGTDTFLTVPIGDRFQVLRVCRFFMVAGALFMNFCLSSFISLSFFLSVCSKTSVINYLPV